MWIARDKNGYIRLYTEFPSQKKDLQNGYESWDWCTDMDKMIGYIPSDLFPELKYEDGPIEVEITEITKKVDNKPDFIFGAKCHYCKKEFFYTEKDIDVTGAFVKCPDCKKEICILE